MKFNIMQFYSLSCQFLTRRLKCSPLTHYPLIPSTNALSGVRVRKFMYVNVQVCRYETVRQTTLNSMVSRGFRNCNLPVFLVNYFVGSITHCKFGKDNYSILLVSILKKFLLLGLNFTQLCRGNLFLFK